MLTSYKQDIKIWRDQTIYSKAWNILQHDQIHDYLKGEPVPYYQTTREISNQNGERALLFIRKSKITDHNYRSIILSTYPFKFSTNKQLIPPNPQQIYNWVPLNPQPKIGWDILSTFPWSSPWN